ncbi:MAG: radical SAM protein [Candidatus Omnitrophota bacterium]
MKEKYSLDLALVMCPAWGVQQPPVGISYLKGFLKERGISVSCFDLSLDLYKVFVEKKYWDLNYPEYFIDRQLCEKYILPFLWPFINKWANQILDLNPKVVGFSLFMSSSFASLLLAQQLKKLNPELVIIGGGPEVTRFKRILVDSIRRFASLNDEIITSDTFDLLIDGEGEETLYEILSLLKQGRDFQSVKGAVYMRDGKIVANEARKLLDDLDVLPSADYDDFTLEGYARITLPLVTSRGCVNRCTFCADSPLWKVYRYRSAEKVLEEIKFLVEKHNKKEFEIMDSTFNGNIRRVERICDLILESKLNIRWSAKVILNKGMSYELLKKMKEAGCSSLAYGIESGSPRVLKDMRKNNDFEEAKRIIKDTWRSGIQVNCFFIIGYPTETEEDFELTLDFIKENAEFIYCFDQITGCHIEEDSYLGLNLDNYGIIFKEDGWYSQHSTPEIRKERLGRFRSLARELHKHYQCEVQA